MEQQTASKFDKKYFKAVYCYFAYLAYMQCTSRKMLDWVKHKLDCSTPGLPVHHQLPEFTQTHVQRVGDAIQPSHPRSSPSPAPNPSQHQGLFQWVNSLHEVAKLLEFQLQHQSFQWIFRTAWISLLSKGLSKVFSNTTVQKHQFFSAQLSL